MPFILVWVVLEFVTLRGWKETFYCVESVIEVIDETVNGTGLEGVVGNIGVENLRVGVNYSGGVARGSL